MNRKFMKAEEEILTEFYVSHGWKFCQQKIMADFNRSWGRNNLYEKAIGMRLMTTTSEGLKFTMPKVNGPWPKIPKVAA